MLTRLHSKLRKGYFFGYVAGSGSEDMVLAITGERPKMVGNAILEGYELRIQRLPEITAAGENSRELLRKVWGDDFKSYVLVKKHGTQVSGALFRVSVKARHKLDQWELVDMGWYKKAFVEVGLVDTGQKRRYLIQTRVQNRSRHLRTDFG